MKVTEAPNYLYLQDKVREFKGKEVLVLDGEIYTYGRQGCFGGLFSGIRVSSSLGILNDDKLVYEDTRVSLPTDGHVSLDSFRINDWEFKEEPVNLGMWGVLSYMHILLEEKFPDSFGPITTHSLHVLFGEDVEKYLGIDRRLREHLPLEKMGREITGKELDTFLKTFEIKKEDSDEEYVSEYQQVLDLLNANSQRELAFDDINV